MRIAVIGGGKSRMLAARLLAGEHDLHVFEAGDYVGKHTNTVTVELGGERYSRDTGFMVFNDRAHLETEVRECRAGGLGLNGSLPGLVRQPWRSTD
jgi:predicted NAD/FAD-binding protein